MCNSTLVSIPILYYQIPTKEKLKTICPELLVHESEFENVNVLQYIILQYLYASEYTCKKFPWILFCTSYYNYNNQCKWQQRTSDYNATTGKSSSFLTVSPRAKILIRLQYIREESITINK